MAIPDGAHYVPGSMRRSVRLPDGSIVPRQAAENLTARTRGFTSEYSRRLSFRHSKARKDYQAGLQRAQSLGISRADYDNARALVHEDYRLNGNDMDKSPDGPLADYLKKIGRRSESEARWVGSYDGPSI